MNQKSNIPVRCLSYLALPSKRESPAKTLLIGANSSRSLTSSVLITACGGGVEWSAMDAGADSRGRRWGRPGGHRWRVGLLITRSPTVCAPRGPDGHAVFYYLLSLPIVVHPGDSLQPERKSRMSRPFFGLHARPYTYPSALYVLTPSPFFASSPLIRPRGHTQI